MKKYYAFLFMLGGLWLSCEIDPGLEPTQSGFSGTVYFENAVPEKTDKVIVVAVRKFPPAGVTDLLTGPSLSMDQDSSDFTFYVPPETYEAVGVVWKELDQPWSISNIIGIYFPTYNHFQPGPVVVSERHSMVTDVDINADYSLASSASESGISGTIRVRGDWPSSAVSVLVAASEKNLPMSLLDIKFGLPIEAGFDSTSFALSLPPATYNLVGVLLIEKDSPVGLQSVKAFYKKTPTSLSPSLVQISTDTTWVDHVDMTLVF